MPIVPVEASVAPPTSGDAAPDAGTTPSTDRVRVTDATPGVAAVADEQRIAAVLKRFTDAYTQLDAPAAKAVWPSVDGRALSRAFNALESQSIEFDDCTVHLPARRRAQRVWATLPTCRRSDGGRRGPSTGTGIS